MPHRIFSTEKSREIDEECKVVLAYAKEIMVSEGWTWTNVNLGSFTKGFKGGVYIRAKTPDDATINLSFSFDLPKIRIHHGMLIFFGDTSSPKFEEELILWMKKLSK